MKDADSVASLDWQTFAELTDYKQTPNYAATLDYCERLANASPLIELTSFGKSGEGRNLPLLIAAADGALTPAAARTKGKAVILIQACIHAGEPDGKDAGLALLRDMAITKQRESLLQNAVILFMPIYNPDGHERSSPYNRINQNGPAEMGWRTTTGYLNLNRDYMKADAPETRAWLKLWNEWKPDLFIDCHVTDGADYRYNITYHHEHHQGVPTSVLKWEEEVFAARVPPAMEREGDVVSWYLEFKDNRDFTKGIVDFSGSPRFSTGYVPLRNRPGILIETHMLKAYRSRVLGTYNLLRFTLEEINKDPRRLIEAGRVAEEEAVSVADQFPIRFVLNQESTPHQLKALSYETNLSEVSGTLRVKFGSEPLDVTVPMYKTFDVVVSIVPPIYYLVPPQWHAVIDVLQWHGVELQRMTSARKLEIESYRFSDVSFPAGPFEGRFLPRFRTETVCEQRTFPAGTAIVPVAQKASRVVMNLLEPQAPDSFVSWGFFNSVFEKKEYGEAYVLETMAREMMENDPLLRLEFEEKLIAEPAFAASAADRLEFFYKRSPYWDQEMNLYPVGRVVNPAVFS